MAPVCAHIPRTHSISRHVLSSDQVEHIRRALLSWFSANARVLPWRVPSIAYGSVPYKDYVHRLYKCLISETMLQQTQVKTVIAYYTKWLDKFPSIEDLAAANEEEVMACWAGLGYYSRAKRLQQAAKYLCDEFVFKELEFPREPEQWIKGVPGVGPYTAGAILSISFGIRSAIVDGNVQRVLSRVLAVHGDTSTPKSSGSKLIWERAGQLVQGEDPGVLNQSLMELGATICSPTLPSCGQCPINSNCLAYSQSLSLKPTSQDFFGGTQQKRGSKTAECWDIEDLCDICPSSINPSESSLNSKTYIQNFYPYKPPKKAQRQESAVVTVLTRTNHDIREIYLEKKEKGLLSGLYDFPTTLLPISSDFADPQQLALDHAQGFEDAQLKGASTHLFTHIKRTSYVICANASDVECPNMIGYLKALKVFNNSGRWIDIEKVSDLGVSELCLKNLRLAMTTTAQFGKKRKLVSETKKVAKKKKKIIPCALVTTNGQHSVVERSVEAVIVPLDAQPRSGMTSQAGSPDESAELGSSCMESKVNKVEQKETLGPRKSKIFELFQRQRHK